MFDPSKLTREQQEELMRQWAEHARQHNAQMRDADTGSALTIVFLIIIGGVCSMSHVITQLYIPHACFVLALILVTVKGISKMFIHGDDPDFLN